MVLVALLSLTWMAVKEIRAGLTLERTEQSRRVVELAVSLIRDGADAARQGRLSEAEAQRSLKNRCAPFAQAAAQQSVATDAIAATSEQGRGFAVVTDEVRKLAGRTGEASRCITTLVDTVRERVTSLSLTLSDSVQTVDSSISAAQRASAIETLSHCAQANAEAAHAVKQTAEKMDRLVARFRVTPVDHPVEKSAQRRLAGSGADWAASTATG